MNMWALLMIALFVLAFVGILYLASRIRKFTFFKRITKEKRIMQIIVSILIVVAITAVLWLAWGSMNAIICILHLLVFWLISDGIFALIKKLGKRHLYVIMPESQRLFLRWDIWESAGIRHIMSGRQHTTYRQTKRLES